MDFGKVAWTCCLLGFVAFHSYIEAAPADARITSVPGYNGSLPSDHYAGYVKISKAKNLYYYFVTSEGNATKDPVVLWLNGGPGCSSFDGFVYEHGPFNFEAGKTAGSLPKLYLNPYSWTKVSNIIYLDSPAGVGLSYSENVDDYTTGDLQTASDTHAFLLKWFEEYPEFLSNPFYISGESYAGIYVPTLGSAVVKGIEALVTPILNFKGYMVGNGVTDKVFDGNALVPFVHGMGLISEDQFQDAVDACKGNYYDTADSVCDTKLAVIDQEVSSINIYNILEPCYHDPEMQKVVANMENVPESFKRLGQTDRPFQIRRRMFGRAWPMRAPVREGNVPTWPQISGVPCTDDRIASVWLNDESVRKAIHSQTKEVAGEWAICTDRINFFHDAGSMIPYHANLTSKGYRAFIYSGDHDMCVPYTGTEAWTRSLDYAITDEWRPWIVDKQVAGYTQGYVHNLTFATIKGAGHTVPEYKPKEALSFYTRWLAGQSL